MRIYQTDNLFSLSLPLNFQAPGMRLLSSWMCRSHCHRIIKLSGTLQQFAPEKELIENVHGVRRSFLDTGEKLRTKLTSPDIDEDPIFSANATPTIYFIGKMLWSKGLESLMDLIQYAEDSAGLRVEVDMYGGGPNKDEASERADKMGLDMNELQNVQEVIIKTDKKQIIISKPSVTEMKAKDSSIFTVTADSYEEVELAVQIFSDEDIQLVSQQAGVDEEKAKSALEEAKGDLARAILLLTSG